MSSSNQQQWSNEQSDLTLSEFYQRGSPDAIRLDSSLHSYVCPAFHFLKVIANNRILNTAISRKKTRRTLLKDGWDIWKIGGLKALYAGVIPATVLTVGAELNFELLWNDFPDTL